MIKCMVWIVIWSVAFCGGRKTREPGEKPLEQEQELTTNSTDTCKLGIKPRPQWPVGDERSHQCPIPVPPCTLWLDQTAWQVCRWSVELLTLFWQNKLHNSPFIQEHFHVKFILSNSQSDTREKCSAHACLPCFRRIFAIEIIRDNKTNLDSGREIQKSKLHTQKISLEFHKHKVY